jgi:hypothetical protein
MDLYFNLQTKYSLVFPGILKLLAEVPPSSARLVLGNRVRASAAEADASSSCDRQGADALLLSSNAFVFSGMRGSYHVGF